MSDELMKQQHSAMMAPDFMSQDKGKGTEDMTRFVIPPRLIITQPLSQPPLDNYTPGTPIIMPNEQVLGQFDAKEGSLLEPFIAVPIFFYPEWTLENPRSVRATKGAIIERSLDPAGELAMRAENPKTREFQCPDAKVGEMCKYVTRLNFILYILREDVQAPVLVTFKIAEMRTGMAFNSLIKSRRAPIFGCQFAFDVGKRENDQGKWYGFDISNPPESVGPWVSPEMYGEFKDQYEKFVEAHEAKLLIANDDPADYIYTPPGEGEAEPEM